MFITNSPINETSGGGVVSYNIMKALENVTCLDRIYSSTQFEGELYNNIPAYCLTPESVGYSTFNNPFFEDYAIHHHLLENPTEHHINMIVFYGAPYKLVAHECGFHGVIVSDVAAHNIELSWVEHQKLGVNYPYPHLTNNTVWKMYSGHLVVSDVVITHSKRSAEYIKRKAEIPDRVFMKVIPHGCTLPDKIPPYPEQVTPGYMGAAGIDKGIHYLFMFVRASGIDTLVLGGKDFKNFVFREDADRYKTLGFVDDLSDFYKEISVYLQPTVTEGFGITGLEAMAYGRPVITTEETGIADLITDGKEGFIIPRPENDSLYLVDRFRYFIDNPSEVERMGKEARRTAEKYTWDNVVAMYEDLLNWCLD